jgi:hypothetical protein
MAEQASSLKRPCIWAASNVASIRSTAPTTSSFGKGKATKSSLRPSKQCDKHEVAWQLLLAQIKMQQLGESHAKGAASRTSKPVDHSIEKMATRN